MKSDKYYLTPEQRNHKREYDRKYAENNKERIREMQRRKYLRTRERILEKQRKRRLENPEEVREIQRAYRAKRRSIFNQRAKEYKARLGEAFLERARQWSRDKYRKDPQFKLRRLLARGLLRAVGRNTKRSLHANEFLGCSIQDCRAHIESLWKEGMNWENHGPSGWHIDHIRPLSYFDFTKKEQIAAALHYTNLQPLWWNENLSKGTKIV